MKSGYIKEIFVLFWFIMLPLFCHGLSPDKAISQYVHSNWGLEEGLPQNTVNSILQTSDGYIWLSTQEGLVRFDGVRFKVYDKRNVPEITTSYIRTLCEDSKGNLWVGTNGGGAVCINDGKFKLYANHEEVPENQVFRIIEDSSGSIWFGTSGGLTRLKNSRFKTFTVKQGLSDNQVRSLLEDSKGFLWIGTERGLNRMNLQNETIATYGKGNGLLNETIWSIYEDREGVLWFGTYGGGLARREGNGFVSFTTEHGLTGDIIKDIYQDRDGNMWIATYGGGLNRMEKNKTFTAFTEKKRTVQRQPVVSL